MSGLATPLLVLIFVGAAAAIWVAGIQLSDQTDVLSQRLHLGSALGGLILLALATNLPEIAIVAGAAVAGNVGVAVGNIIVLTVVYVTGLLFRPARRVGRMGVDSLAVLALYAASVAGLFAIAGH